MWIESHQNLARHPKIFRLSRLLKINKAQAIGHLHLLWWWTLDFSPTGDLSAFTSCELAEAAEWNRDHEAFVNALKETGWIDQDGESLCVHDWNDFAGKMIIRRESNKERMKGKREHVQNTCSARAAHVQDTCNAQTEHVQRTCEATEQDSTEQNRTGQNNAPVPAVPDWLEKEAVRIFGNAPVSVLIQWAGTYPLDWIRNAMAATEQAKKRDSRYTTGILKRYAAEGGPEKQPEIKTRHNQAAKSAAYEKASDRKEWICPVCGFPSTSVNRPTCPRKCSEPMQERIDGKQQQ